MRFWFAPHSDVPLYEQLVTQVRLAILSGDLQPGDRLPSTRELARRFAIHPNTVSAGYRELEHQGWTELRHGSGVYVCEPQQADPASGTTLDAYIAAFFRGARAAGFSRAQLRGQLAQWLETPSPDHWLLIEADPELRRILLAEMRPLTNSGVQEASPEDCASLDMAGAVACCRPTQETVARACVPSGTELVVLPITSATEWLTPWLPAPTGHLIAVVSHWPEFVAIARTMLSAAGVPVDALLFRDARSPHWARGLDQASGVLCDTYTASLPDLPSGPQVVVFPVLAQSAREVLTLSPL